MTLFLIDFNLPDYPGFVAASRVNARNYRHALLRAARVELRMWHSEATRCRVAKKGDDKTVIFVRKGKISKWVHQ